MKKLKTITSILLIQAMLLQNVALAGETAYVKQCAAVSNLSPALPITSNLFRDICNEYYERLKDVSLLSSKGIEVIHERTVPGNKSVLATFDIHGTLLVPTWKEEYRRVYEYFIGKKPTEKWIKEFVVHKSDKEITETISRISNASHKEIAEKIRSERNTLREQEVPPLMPMALEAIKTLKKRGVPIVLMSGSKRELVIHQLRKRGVLDYVKEENILGREVNDRGDYNREAVIEALHVQFPEHTIVLFDDWKTGMKKVKELGGINIGIPQGEYDSTGGDKEFKDNRFALVQAGADYIMHDWSEFSVIEKIITVPLNIQKYDKRIPVAQGPAKKLIGILPASRANPLSLYIKVSDDLKYITYYEVLDDTKVFSQDGTVDYKAIKKKKIIKIPSSYLITPQRYIENIIEEKTRKYLLELLSQNKRYTEYGGTITSWDIDVDKDVWSTNIDTAYLHKAMKELGYLTNANIESVIEIGAGGGHGITTLMHYLPNIKDIAVTDISIYALRTTKRSLSAYLKDGVNISYYLGKGLKTIGKKADLILVNPPYIPTPPWTQNDQGDPYRGTGLIREILEMGFQKLNPENPDASILINISSLAKNDLNKYLKEFGDRLIVEEVGEAVEVPMKNWVTVEKVYEPLDVPLKIRAINQEWKDWLVKEGGLRYKKDAKPGEQPYWHTLQTYRIRVNRESRNKSKASFAINDFSKVIFPGVKIFDFGSGPKALIRWSWGKKIIKHYKAVEYYGIDKEGLCLADMVENLIRKFIKAFYRWKNSPNKSTAEYISQSYLDPLPEKLGKADVIVLNSAFLTKDYLRRVKNGDVARGIYDNLKPGGRAFILTERHEVTYGEKVITTPDEVGRKAFKISLENIFGSENVIETEIPSGYFQETLTSYKKSIEEDDIKINFFQVRKPAQQWHYKQSPPESINKPLIKNGKLNIYEFRNMIHNIVMDCCKTDEERQALNKYPVEIFGSALYLAEDGWADLELISDIDINIPSIKFLPLAGYIIEAKERIDEALRNYRDETIKSIKFNKELSAYVKTYDIVLKDGTKSINHELAVNFERRLDFYWDLYIDPEERKEIFDKETVSQAQRYLNIVSNSQLPSSWLIDQDLLRKFLKRVVLFTKLAGYSEWKKYREFLQKPELDIKDFQEIANTMRLIKEQIDNKTLNIFKISHINNILKPWHNQTFVHEDIPLKKIKPVYCNEISGELIEQAI